MPPASSILVTALLENLFALTVNFLSNEPLAKTLIPHKLFFIIPLSFKISGVTVSPSLKNLFNSSRLIVANSVLNLLFLKVSPTQDYRPHSRP